jgi:hydrogenase maturation protease
LVLGLGNLLLADDAVGLRLLVQSAAGVLGIVDAEFVDGGTQGIALLGRIAGRQGVILLDAIGLGDAPGAVHVLRDAEVWQFRARKARTAHEGNALELLETARLLGDEPEHIAVIGVEPAVIRTAIGLSPSIEDAMPAALAKSLEVLQSMTGQLPATKKQLS